MTYNEENQKGDSKMLTLIYMWFLKLKKKHEDYEEACKELGDD